MKKPLVFAILSLFITRPSSANCQCSGGPGMGLVNCELNTCGKGQEADKQLVLFEKLLFEVIRNPKSMQKLDSVNPKKLLAKTEVSCIPTKAL